MGKASVTQLRLAPGETQRIVKCMLNCAQKSAAEILEIAVFGSRTDPQKQGGDLDLYVKIRKDPSNMPRALKSDLLLALEDELGDQKIDLIVNDGSVPSSPFLNIIEDTKVILWTPHT